MFIEFFYYLKERLPVNITEKIKEIEAYFFNFAKHSSQKKILRILVAFQTI